MIQQHNTNVFKAKKYKNFAFYLNQFILFFQ